MDRDKGRVVRAALWEPISLPVLVVSQSGEAPLAPGDRRPISRGKPCSVPGGVLDPCPATDGSMEWVEIDPRVGGVESVTVDLGSVISARAVTLRGLDPVQAVVEGSADGAAWSELAPYDGLSESFLHVPLTPPVALRYVRLRAERDSLHRIREISVFN